jgi:integrase
MSPEPDAAKAEGHFERALAIARSQQAKSFEPRAAISMARLWHDQGNRDEAREPLAPVYGWFTEGFDTLSLARSDLGMRPIAEIVAPEVLHVLKTVEARGRLDTAKRLRATIGQVFRLAVATGRADADPTPSLRGALASPVVQHRAAIVEPKAFGGLLRAIAGYDGALETKAALELLALTFARPGEIRAAEWREFELDTAVWSIRRRR